MVRPRTGSPRMKNRSYISNYSSQNGGDHPSAFRSSRGGGSGKAPPSWREASNRGRKAPYPDRWPAPWQQKSPQGRDRGPSPWQSKSQDSYLGYNSQSSDTHRHYGHPAPRPGPDQRRPLPHEPGLGRPPHRPHDGAHVAGSGRPPHRPHDGAHVAGSGRPPHKQYDGGLCRFKSQPHAPEHRSHKQVHSQLPHQRSPFRPPRQEQRPWGRSQSPSYASRPLPKPQHIGQAGDRGRGRGRGRRGGGSSGNGSEREAFWGGRGSCTGHSFTSPRLHHPQPQNGEGRCPPHSPLRKEREFHSRERWSSSTERDCNERRSRERERIGSGRHGNEPEHWPPHSPSQYRPPPHTSSSWKASLPLGPPKPSASRRFPSHHTARGAERFPSHHASRGPERRSSGYKRKYPEMPEQSHPPPPLFKHFRQEQSLAPPLRGFGGRGLSLRDKSRLLKNRKFREESVARFKMLPPPHASRGRPTSMQTRMAYTPGPGRPPMPRHQEAGHHMDASARKLPKRSSPPRKASSEHSPAPEHPVCDGDHDEHRSPQYRHPSGRHSPVPVDQHLPLDLVVVSHWQAEASENDGDCDDHVDAADTVEIHSEHSSSLQKAPPKAAASPQDQSVQSKRLVRRPLMSLKTVRPLRKFGQVQAIVATKRSQSIVSKYRLMRQRAPPVPAPVSQSVQSTSHRRW